MPELPEVETTRRGIEPHIKQSRLKNVVIRQAQLRWPIPGNLNTLLSKQMLNSVDRRGKYLLFNFTEGTVLLHLGMSGSLRIVSNTQPVGKHDHVDFVFESGTCLRFTDPRRFGSILWAGAEPFAHKLLSKLGPEPLSEDFDGQYLHKSAKTRSVAVKTFIMNSHVVVGVGNIYANEALFAAGISPVKSAGRISLIKYSELAEAIKRILSSAIAQGGTTLKDFVGGDGKPGYFKQELNVYGRAGEACVACGKVLKEKRMASRSTVYCSHCQR